eukprot:TRINITY_DN9810_c0_g1_i1.p1 TRINITY_DN9810_c0_g1~~TRINITY_DN9810_c0_g1_i1.p1  ORF type:complete len:360 (+),score=83.77 TRINITY_DN9810_c0_g1_i1:74-1153(+)
MANGQPLDMSHLAEIGILSWGTASFAVAPASSMSELSSVKLTANCLEDRACNKSRATPAQSPSTAKKAEAPKELSADELKCLSKEERKAYHQARLAAGVGNSNAGKKPITKEERRVMQEAQRKAKDEKKETLGEREALLAELKLQGLSEDQAKVLMAEMSGAPIVEGDDEQDEDEEDDLLSGVKRWMSEVGSEKTNKDSIRDFNMKVRFQGHVDSTPPDHLTCLLKVVAAEACSRLDLTGAKPPQPAAIAKSITPAMRQWAGIIGGLYEKIDDVFAAADVIVQVIAEEVRAACGDAPANVKDCVIVGHLLAIREEVEVIADEEILAGCRKLDSPGPVIAKFVTFLEEEVNGDSDDDDED